MNSFLMIKFPFIVCLLVLCLLIIGAEPYKINVSIDVPTDRESSGLVKFVEPLPPYGQFATGAVVGFVASRVVVQAAVRIVKVAGTFFILSEVLNRTGYLNVDMNNVNKGFMKNIEMKSKSAINDFRIFTENHIQQAPKDFKSFIRSGFGNKSEEKNHLSGGIAAGAIAGFLL